eukprot:jgi/Botrbrau1/4246/Bobra.0044s0041.1
MALQLCFSIWQSIGKLGARSTCISCQAMLPLLQGDDENFSLAASVVASSTGCGNRGIAHAAWGGDPLILIIYSIAVVCELLRSFPTTRWPWVA